MNILKRLHDNLYGSSTWMIWDAQLTYTHLVVKLTDYHDNHFSYKIKLSNLNEHSVDKLIKTIVDFDVKKYIITKLAEKTKHIYGISIADEWFDIYERDHNHSVLQILAFRSLNIKQILELLK